MALSNGAARPMRRAREDEAARRLGSEHVEVVLFAGGEVAAGASWRGRVLGERHVAPGSARRHLQRGGRAVGALEGGGIRRSGRGKTARGAEARLDTDHRAAAGETEVLPSGSAGKSSSAIAIDDRHRSAASPLVDPEEPALGDARSRSPAGSPFR
jgi:hypothetical protein